VCRSPWVVMRLARPARRHVEGTTSFNAKPFSPCVREQGLRTPIADSVLAGENPFRAPDGFGEVIEGTATALTWSGITADVFAHGDQVLDLSRASAGLVKAVEAAEPVVEAASRIIGPASVAVDLVLVADGKISRTEFLSNTTITGVAIINPEAWLPAALSFAGKAVGDMAFPGGWHGMDSDSANHVEEFNRSFVNNVAYSVAGP